MTVSEHPGSCSTGYYLVVFCAVGGLWAGAGDACAEGEAGVRAGPPEG